MPKLKPGDEPDELDTDDGEGRQGEDEQQAPPPVVTTDEPPDEGAGP